MVTQKMQRVRLYEPELKIVHRLSRLLFQDNDSAAIRHMIRVYGAAHDVVMEDDVTDAMALAGEKGQ